MVEMLLLIWKTITLNKQKRFKKAARIYTGRRMLLKKRKIIFILILVLLFLCVVILYVSKHSLVATQQVVSNEKCKNKFRIIQITDLHNSKFGKFNESLIEKVAAEYPDLILLTGDLLNSDEQDTSIALELISELSKIAPTYASYGNHEKEYEKNYGTNLTTAFEQAGAKVLEFSYEDIEVNGQKLRIGGLYGYCTPAKVSDELPTVPILHNHMR